MDYVIDPIETSYFSIYNWQTALPVGTWWCPLHQGIVEELGNFWEAAQQHD